MTTVFAVFKNGVYRHECGGIFTTFELAKSAALALLRGERDDYHTYDVIYFSLDEQTPQTQLKQHGLGYDGSPYYFGGRLEERSPCFIASRVKHDVGVWTDPEFEKEIDNSDVNSRPEV